MCVCVCACARACARARARVCYIARKHNRYGLAGKHRLKTLAIKLYLKLMASGMSTVGMLIVTIYVGIVKQRCPQV